MILLWICLLDISYAKNINIYFEWFILNEFLWYFIFPATQKEKKKGYEFSVPTILRWLYSLQLHALLSSSLKTLNLFLSLLFTFESLSLLALPDSLLFASSPPSATPETPINHPPRSPTSGARNPNPNPNSPHPLSFQIRILPRMMMNGKKEREMMPVDISTPGMELRYLLLKLRRRREWMKRWRGWSVLLLTLSMGLSLASEPGQRFELRWPSWWLSWKLWIPHLLRWMNLTFWVEIGCCCKLESFCMFWIICV